MNDMRPTIVPKSDQLNADDLLGRTMMITVTKVLINAEADQPVSIHYEGDNGKPFKICKSMRRVLVTVWGPDASKYAGRRMTLYRDDKVAFGGQAVGGIRISHMSDIDREVTMALTATRAQRKPFTVRPLNDTAEPTKAAHGPENGHSVDLDEGLSDYADTVEFEIDTATDARKLHAWFNGEAMKTTEWMALREADPGRANALKAKASAKVQDLKVPT
jgi:hypothetical protein